MTIKTLVVVLVIIKSKTKTTKQNSKIAADYTTSIFHELSCSI